MGSGLSMASVNKIKELANAREYGLALDILESQDLTKSLNPQFLRLCGEIYIYNRRYKDARHILLMAHKLAPEAKRIIYTLMLLYLKMGYMSLARRYYDIYMADADEAVLETKQVMYIYNKATKQSVDDIEQYIAPTYSNTMDYEWTYETILVYLMQNRDKEAEALIHLYGATYKDSEHDVSIRNIVDGNADLRDAFDTFAKEEQSDDDPEQDEERKLEAVLLEADDLRINPPEPEIVIMVDDNDDDEIVSKRKLKKMLKEQERKEKEAASEHMTDNIEDTEEKEDNKDIQADKATEENMTEPADADDADNVEQHTEDGQNSEKKSFIKNIFSKVRRKDNSEEKASDDELAVTDDTSDAPEEKPTEDSVEDSVKKPAEECLDEGVEQSEEEKAEEYRRARDIFFGEEDGEKIVADVEEKSSDSENAESESTYGDNDMREIHIKERNSIKKPVVMVDMGDDDFTAESDTVENLHDSEEFANPFDSIVVVKGEEAAQGYKIKKSISFETAELADEDETAEFEVDDFSSWDSEEDEFGEMNTAEIEEEAEAESEIEAEPEIETEPEVEEEVEVEPEVETEIEVEVEAEVEPEIEIESETEEEPEIEPELESEPEAEVEAEVEPNVEAKAEVEEESETEEEVEVEPEVEEETDTESEPEYEQDLDSLFKIPPKKKLDYPVFKSSLFPDYHKDEPEIENNFGDILQEAQDKIHENILKEEEMQREAEALLASLGIDLGNISVTSDYLDDINETLNEGPSRDELKASLKINSVQREVLNKLKEYR